MVNLAIREHVKFVTKKDIMHERVQQKRKPLPINFKTSEKVGKGHFLFKKFYFLKAKTKDQRFTIKIYI